ncbi:MAG: DUF4317 domain-containing protein [Clostridia bacterium]|nr:DUF4317 domain-containing protein [Clostridia bacterium]
MNKSDIAKIKRRLTADSRNPIVIRGRYVNGKKAVVSEFSRSLMSLTQTECDKYTQIFKRALSGEIGRNLTQLTFTMNEVMEGETHARLMQLVHGGFEDETAANAFLDAVTENTKLEGNNLILLMHDTWDTDFSRSNRDEGALETENASNVFEYIMCVVCPVKQGKPALSYDFADNDFKTREPDYIVNAPVMGFMFPCFEDGGANISGALFYSRDMGEDHSDFLTSALNANEITPALEKRESFKAVLMDALEEECSYDVVENMNSQLVEKLDEQKRDKEADPARVGGKELADMLLRSGVSDDRAESFKEKFDQEFGAGADLPLAGIAEDKQFELRTPDVLVKVSSKQASLIETRIIDGMKYILIPADDGVTVNGISIDI